MNAAVMARSAYGTPVRGTRTHRENEYELFARTTRKLREAHERKDTDFPALAAAVHENRALWMALAVDVADDENALPQGLRAQIFYLAQFTAQHSQKVLLDAADVQALVFVNSCIMKGLRHEGSEE